MRKLRFRDVLTHPRSHSHQWCLGCTEPCGCEGYSAQCSCYDLPKVKCDKHRLYILMDLGCATWGKADSPNLSLLAFSVFCWVTACEIGRCRIIAERNQESRPFYCCYKAKTQWFQIFTPNSFPMSILSLYILKGYITSIGNTNSIQ